MFAVRNPKICTKDCVCLYVCPTGATSTEDGTIDASKCIDGCRLCVDACPSHAIYLVPRRFPQQPPVDEKLLEPLIELLEAKAAVATRLSRAAETESDPIARRVLGALERSSRILAEDCVRAAGLMVPQAGWLRDLLNSGVLDTLLEGNEADREHFRAVVEKVLEALDNERDAENVTPVVCERCGFCSPDAPLPGSCPNCGADAIKQAGS